MTSENEPRTLAALRRGRVLPILRLRDHGRAVDIAEVLVAAGVQAPPGSPPGRSRSGSAPT